MKCVSTATASIFSSGSTTGTDFDSMINAPISDLDVVVLAPIGKDCAFIRQLLRQSGVSVRGLENAAALIASIPENAGAAVVSEEALSEGDITALARKLQSQPQWSDF